MRKGFLIYEVMRKYLVTYEEAVSHITMCNCSLMNFLIYEKFFYFLSYQCAFGMAAAKKACWIFPNQVTHVTTWFAKFTECRMKPQQLLADSKNMALILYLYIQMHHHKVLRVQLHLTANLVLLMSIIVIYKKGRGGW